MKNMKKLLALVLAVMMLASLATTAFADADEDAPAYSITVENSNSAISIDGKTYSAYKLFDLTRNGETNAYSYSITTSNQFYKDDEEGGAREIIETYFTLTGTQVAGVFNVAPKDGYDARAFADAIQGVLSKMTADATSEEAADEEAVIPLSSDGYYIVVGTADPTEEGSTGEITAAVAIDNANPDPVVKVKADAPTIDKFIAEADSAEGEKGLGTAQDVGSVVAFVSESKVPDMTGYETYTFIIHDTMSTGLTFINDEDHPLTLAIGDGEDAELDVGTDYTLTTTDLSDGCTFEITIADMTEYTSGDAVTLNYYAKINENALSTAVETNKIKLEYSNNPYDSDSTGVTPDHTVYVYDFDIVIDKYAKVYNEETETKTPLVGAEFVLYNEDGAYYYWNDTDKKVEWYTLAENETIEAALTAEKPITVVETDENGWAHFEGLDVGTYYLHETNAPEGFNLLLEDPEVIITASYDTDGSLSETSATLNEAETKYELTKSIENKSGTVLPSTGGIGTTIFYILGAVLVLGAGVLLITKKRMSVEK